MATRRIADYTITRELGRGGMGTVYQALSSEGATVAVKTVLLPENVDARARWEAIERFQREARAARSLSHPNICQVLDFGAEEDTLFIVMEFLDGDTVRQLIDLAGAIRLGRAVEIMRGVAEALAHAHDREIVHRDIKPENIIVLRGGQVKLADFGLASILRETTLTQTGVTMGTVYYMSPEQVRGERLDGRSDIFSLGSTFYEMLTGTRPFEGDDRIAVMNQILRKDLAPVAGAPPSVSETLERCLRKDPQERFQSTREVIASLSAIEPETATAPTALLPEAEPTAKAASPRRRPWLRRALRRWPVLAVATAALVAVGALALLTAKDGKPTHPSVVPPPRLDTPEAREADVLRRANFTDEVDFRRNPGAFTVYSGRGGTVAVEGDALVLDGRDACGSLYMGRYTGWGISEFVIEARMTRLAGTKEPLPGETTMYGIGFGAWPTQAYYFTVFIHGEVAILRWWGGTLNPPQALVTEAEAVEAAIKDQVNVMKVVRCGDCLDVWVDGRHLLTGYDFDIGPGILSFFATEGMRVAFSDVRVAGIDLGTLSRDVQDHRRRLEMREAVALLEYLHRYKVGDRTDQIESARASPDYRETVLVVTSSDPAAMVASQGAAARLEQAINARGRGRDWRFAAKLTDAIDMYQERCPLITVGIGEPWDSANLGIGRLAEALPRDPVSTEDMRIDHDMARGRHNRVAIWGSSKDKTEEAVDLFMESGLLNRYLDMIWEKR